MKKSTLRAWGIFTSLILAASISGFTQSAFLPKNLGANINSTYDDINPVISSDGKSLFFVRVNHPENTFGESDSEDIWFSKRISDSTWSAATRITNLNIGRYNSVLGISSDGNSLLLNGIFNKKGNLWKKRGLSVSTKMGDGWSAPTSLEVKGFSRMNRGMRSSGSISSDGKILLLSFSKTFNGEKNDLYVSTQNGNGIWGKPKKIALLNSPANDETPFLAADGKTIYFSSDRVEKGQFNIYKSVCQGGDLQKWSAPKALSDTINTSSWESYYKTSRKGSWAYFSSNNKSKGGADIFRVKLFEENPFIIVNGTVVNATTQNPIKGKSIAIVINGKVIDSLKVNPDSATYRVKLRLGKSYTLSTVINNYVSQPNTLDVSKVKEYSRAKLDLQAAPVPYVLVKGKLLVQNTGLPIPYTFNPKVLINNGAVDSIKLNVNDGVATYEVKLKHGASYDFLAVASKHESVPRKLDLTKIYEYQEVTHDLMVTEEKMAVINGKILDKKTNKPLAKLSTAKVNVEGMSAFIAKIDTVTGAYELKLPLGTTYTVSAGAPNYYPVYETIDIAAEKASVTIFRDLVIVPIEVGQSIRLNNIFFDPGKAILKPESFPELDRVSEFLSNSPQIKIEISGHTDNVGAAATNLKLSQNRAQAVADYVTKKGIEKGRVVAKGYGLSKPVASNATKEGKAQNRRVEFTVLDN